jgi:hypothetical protein
MQNHLQGLLTSGVCLLHDKTQPQIAEKPTKLTLKFDCKNFDHPPIQSWSGIFQLPFFLKIKEFLGSKRMESDEEIIERLTANFYEGIIELCNIWTNAWIAMGPM